MALALALGLSLAGLAMLMLGTGRLFAPSLVGRRAIMLPAGALVYIAVPPARDFATSGLESGLVMAYLGLLWWMMVCWSQAKRSRPPGRVFIVALAFVAGCSVLVRPELALIGGGALIMMLIAVQDGRRRLEIVVAGGLLPVGYQIFRMGYYGLLFPGTALAKDAGGDKWSQGLIYLSNFNRPYALWVPAFLLTGLGLVLWASARRQKGRKGASASSAAGGPLARTVQTPAAVVVFILVSGLLQALYWIRQGGDFMHGRVLLVPLLCLLAPVAVVPVVFPEGTRLSREAGYWLAGGVSALWMAVAGWSLWAANSPGMGADATRVTYSGIVDERRFYAQATGHAHPLTAADYLDYPRMRAVLVALNNTPEGALLLPSGNYDQWDLVPPIPPKQPGTPPDGAPPARRRPPKGAAHSVFHQPRHGGDECRAGCSGDRPDRAGQPTGGAHRPVAARPDRSRQEPLPGLGDRRRAVGEVVSGCAELPRREVRRAGRGGAAMPGDPADAEFGARSDGLPPVPVESCARRLVHPLPNRPCSALRTHQVRPGRAGAGRSPLYRSARHRAVAPRQSAAPRNRQPRTVIGRRIFVSHSVGAR